MECIGWTIGALVLGAITFFIWFWWSLFSNSGPSYTDEDLFEQLWKEEKEDEQI